MLRAYEVPARRRQANERYFAWNFLARGVAMNPFKPRRFVAEGLLKFLGRRFRGGPSIRLERRTDLHGPDAQQFLAAHAEQSFRILIHVSEAPHVQVEHHDGLGGMLDQSAIALFTFPKGLIGRHKLRGAFGNALFQVFADAAQTGFRFRSLLDFPGELLIDFDEPLGGRQGQRHGA